MNSIELNVRNLVSGYGKKSIVFKVSLDVLNGQIVGIIGPNGSGKSTVVKTISGLLPSWSGSVQLDGVRLDGLSPQQIISHGLSFVPQGGKVFIDLSVIENLKIGGFNLTRSRLKIQVEDILETFPLFKEKLRQSAGTLSGGEQQMLSLARAMISTPRIMILDEPSIGLSPKMAKKFLNLILNINQEKKVSFLIVEQKVQEVLSICHQVYGIKLGRVVFQGNSSLLQNNSEKLKDIFL